MLTRFIPIAAIVLLAGCSGSNAPTSATQQAGVTAAITLAADGMACYQQIKGATSASNTVQNVWSAASVVAAGGPCGAIATAGASLVASALNTNTTPVAGATSAAASGATTPAPGS